MGQKDKEKERRDDEADKEKKLKTATDEVKQGETLAATVDPKPKEKKEKDKDKGKDKDKKQKGEKKEKKEKKHKAEAKDGDKGTAADKTVDESKQQDTSKIAILPSIKKAEPPEKKLKAWQDDELEVDSGDEASGPTNLERLAEHSKGVSSSQQAVGDEAAGTGEADTLDAFMVDVSKEVQVGYDRDRRAGEKAELTPNNLGSGGMGVMDASRVKTITLEEIEALMSGGSSSSSSAPASSALTVARAIDEVGTGSAAASTADAQATAPGVVTDGAAPAAAATLQEDEEEEKFHAAFIAEMRRLRGEATSEDKSATEAASEVEQKAEAAESDNAAGNKTGREKKKGVKPSSVKKGTEKRPERLESDPDGTDDSDPGEEQVSYFDLVKRFTTKKTLPEVDHSKVKYYPLRKNLYIQVREITNMKEHEVDDLRRTHGDIKIRGKPCPKPIKNFLQCGLPEKIIKILEKREYEKPFPIQMQAIPALMMGRDLIGVAQTGSGKTLAYLLPMIRQILDQPKLKDGEGPIGFVIAPTRELALQIQREANVFCKAVGLVSVCAFGGGPMGEQLAALKKGAELLVGTPGRLIDVLTTSNGKITNLRRVSFMVLDEADRMFDMGFEPQIGMFLQSTRPDKQVAMFSATLPTHVEALARTVLKKPLEISVGERNTAASNVSQFVEVLEENKKFYRLLQLLGEWHEHGSIIIFVHQQKDVDEMFQELLKYGYPSLALHGGQDQHDRDFTLQDFKDNVANIMIATSVAARGIDVKQVILVINFKAPDHLEDYIHRIGRTGRAGKHGYAWTFIQPDESDRAQDMVDVLRQCGQEVPEKLRRLAEEHQSLVNRGEATKKRRWGGFGGKGFKYDNTERSRQQKERSNAKKEAMIGGDDFMSDEEFKDPWNEDKPMNNKDKKQEKKKEEEVVVVGSDPVSTAAAAAQVAARLHAQAGKQKPQLVPGLNVQFNSGGADGGSGKATQVLRRKTEKEIEEQAQKMAEDTLASLPEAVREKQLPALTAKLKEKLMKAEQAAHIIKPPEPPKPPPPPQSPLMKLPIADVPGVIGLPEVPAVHGSEMVTRSMDALKATLAQPKDATGTAADARLRASKLSGSTITTVAPPGMFADELDINDYPEVARKKITHRDPLLQIEELTGAKLQVKGQYFADERKMPAGSKRLYVEIIGPTQTSVQRAKREVETMMEALAIRTLNIPGLNQVMGGRSGQYNPATGR